jgi:predicted transcriptional regulator
MEPKQTNKKIKTPKQFERYFKGVANHRRIEIIFLIAEQGGISLDGITEILGGNFKTISEHTKKLVQAGLVNKKYRGRQVAHELSPYGIKFLEFMQKFSEL